MDKHTHYVWQKWEIHVLVMTSLVIQALLTLLAPLRKRKHSGFLKISLWLLYLSADSVALMAIGLISRNLEDEEPSSADPKGSIHVFWAPFLLLHLGGPDSITSLALEDNDLWHRHALQLVTQVAATIYVFGLYARRGMVNRLLLPIILMFINGCIKYIERTCALYFASREGIRALYEEAPAKTLEREESSSDDVEVDIEDELQVINQAYFLYEKIRSHLAQDVLTLSNDLERRSRVLFLNQPVGVGIRIIQIELNIIYDKFHTKVFLLYRQRAILRIACFLSVLAAFISFFFCAHNKSVHDYLHRKPIDAGITFTLLASAMLLDVVSFIRFLFSDWCVVMVAKLLDEKPSKHLKSALLVLQRCLRSKDPSAKRWCELSGSYNLLDSSLKQQAAPTIMTKLLKFIFIERIKDGLIDWLYVERQPINQCDLNFVFEVLQRRANQASGNKKATHRLCSARGNLVLEHDHHNISISVYLRYLRRWTLDVDYSQSLLMWHLATDICYRAEFYTFPDNNSELDYRAISKQLSDYMSYLLLRRQELVSQVVGNSIMQLEATKADISAYATTPPTEENLSEFCRNVLYLELDDRIVATANENQSVFHESCSLARELLLLGENKWEIISKVWVEMLCYAAIRSMARANFAQLSKGGELITLVWLFMTQLGFVPFNPSN